ncbi:hypothetical protein M413DRAFT_75481, partial [Hebeloma cylindrosporum]
LLDDLPKTVVSVRDGWQWACSSGAVVSGLLASVSAQLLGFFKADSSFNAAGHSQKGARDFLVAACFMALFLNISATISSFILIDILGEIGFKASTNEEDLKKLGKCETTQDGLLSKFHASPWWRYILWHWLVTFYLGILSLIISVLTYVWMQETKSTQAVMTVAVILTLLPTTFWMFFREFCAPKCRPKSQTRPQSPQNTSTTIP